METIIAVTQSGVPYLSYVWGDRFTTDPATATRFSNERDATWRAIELSYLTHLDAAFFFRPVPV